MSDNDPLDYTNRYNTALTPDQEQAYQQWLQLQSALNRRDMSRDTYDYDMRGAFLGGAARSENAHYPDTFKKPNHPSFSTGSQYNAVDGNQGGVWTQIPTGWTFHPVLRTYRCTVFRVCKITSDEPSRTLSLFCPSSPRCRITCDSR